MLYKYTKKEFPPYAFVPGRNPHPKSNPQGHLYGKPEEEYNQIENHLDSEHYLYGIDLFNHGFYWEAHEVWEGLWNAHKREGYKAEFLKALIKLAAAGVKVKQGQERGILDHSSAAQNIFKTIKNNTQNDIFLGLSLSGLIILIDEIKENVSNNYYNDKQNTDIVLKPLILV